MDTPSMNLAPHENSFGELTKCNENILCDILVWKNDIKYNIYWLTTH